MFNWRLYRLTLLPSLLALVVLLFSVVSRPEALRSDEASDGFDAAAAGALTRELLERAPDRSAGSSGDDAAAGFVESRFRAVPGAEVNVEDFSAEGEDLRNVTLVIPGQSSERIVIAAPRDCATGVCAVSSASATGALLELAQTLAGARHTKTIELVSLDGSTTGSAGAARLASSLASGEPPRAVLVIAAPGAANPERPFVIPYSAGPQSTSIQLIESAKQAVETETGQPGGLRLGTLPSLMRLAVPAGLGEQAPLIRAGEDAVAVTSAGELPLSPSEDGPRSLSAKTLGGTGRAVLALVLALDGHSGPLAHGPEAYVPLAGKLIPGWALSLLALSLLLPVAVVSGDALARVSRRREPILPAALWALAAAAPFVAAALGAYLLALIGAIPDPAFPFDPARNSFGVAAALTTLVLAAIFVACVAAVVRLPLPEHAADALAPSIGALLAFSTLAIWIANPYLALLLVPTAHLWLLAATPELRGRIAAALSLAAAGLVLPAVALASLGDRLGVGAEAPWQLLLMFTGRHFGPLALAPLCLLGGCLLALLRGALRRPPAAIAGPQVRVRGPLGYAGPGSLGGTDSAMPRSGVPR